MILTTNIEVLNAPACIKGCYVVVRYVNSNNAPQLWYYGQYDTKDRADYVAKEIGNGIVFEIYKGDLTKPEKENKIDV